LCLGFLPISAFVQTLTAKTFINPSFSAILVISQTQLAQASIDGYVQGFPETTFLKPTPLPSEIWLNCKKVGGLIRNKPRNSFGFNALWATA
jgi:hypothetical protein